MDWNTNLDLNSIFGFTTDKLYYKVELIWDPSDTTKTPVINSVEFVEGSSLSIPTSLNQYVKSPWLSEEEIDIWEKIGKFQSGSWLILSANIENNSNKQVRLEFEIYEWEELNFVGIYYSEYFDTWVQFKTIPLLSWNYNWRVRTENELWSFSEWVWFWTNNLWEIDFSIFEGFEPYNYGYGFLNGSIDSEILDWWVDYIYDINADLVAKNIVDWLRWDIFESAFDLSSFTDEYSLINAFENTGLDNENLLQNGACYWMAISAVMQETHTWYIDNHFSDFDNEIWTWTVWELESPNRNQNWYWDEYNGTLEAISSMYITQFTWYHQDLIDSWMDTPDEIYNILEQNPNNRYILLFTGINENWVEVWHAVVPYRVDDDKIYVWDNNAPYIDNEDDYDLYSPYEQYFEILDNNDWTFSFENSSYNLDFQDIWLVNIDDIYNWWEKVIPMWFNENETVYTVSWDSDIYVVDEKWRRSWFKNGKKIDEIPWVNVVIPFTNADKNTWKQIYIPDNSNLNLTVKVKWNKKEIYDLMIAWWNYYTKIEGIETNNWELDSFVSKNNSFEIDFNDNKKWNYKLSINNSSKIWTWNIYTLDIQSNTKKHKYEIDWKWLKEDKDNSFILEIDNDDNWDYDLREKLISNSSGKSKLYKLEKNIPWFTKENKDNNDKINSKLNKNEK